MQIFVFLATEHQCASTTQNFVREKMGKIEIQHRTDFADRQHKTEEKKLFFFFYTKKLSTLTLQK